MSPYFFNAGLYCNGYDLSRLAQAYNGVMQENEALFSLGQVIFGPSYKGSAIAVAVAVQGGSKIGWAYDRKEAKDHGEGGLVVGASLKNKNVILADDVMTSGESLGGAFNFVSAQGGYPIACIIAVDRQEKGKDGGLSAVQEFEQKYQIPVKAAVTRDDIIEYIEEMASRDDRWNGILLQMRHYKEQWGA